MLLKLITLRLVVSTEARISNMAGLVEQDLSDDQMHQMLKEAELRMRQAAGQMVLNPTNSQSDAAPMTGLISRLVPAVLLYPSAY